MRDLDTMKVVLVGLGAARVAHRDGTLLDHLEDTYRILERLHCPEHVCLAALFHGAYGTQALHSERIDAVTNTRREEVRAVIGEAAERLVFSFSVMSYDSLGKSFRAVLKAAGQPALTDRRTGNLLPLSRVEFDELLWVKLADVMAHMPARSTETQLDLPAAYDAFWQLVAEHLGPRAVAAWTELIGEARWSQADA